MAASLSTLIYTTFFPLQSSPKKKMFPMKMCSHDIRFNRSPPKGLKTQRHVLGKWGKAHQTNWKKEKDITRFAPKAGQFKRIIWMLDCWEGKTLTPSAHLKKQSLGATTVLSLVVCMWRWPLNCIPFGTHLTPRKKFWGNNEVPCKNSSL